MGCRTFWTEALAKAAADDVENLKRHAPDLGKEVRVIDDEDELQKHRVNGAPAATLTACAGSLWPYKLIAFILEKAIKDGHLNLQTKTPVTKIEPCTEGHADDELATALGPMQQVLHTPRGVIKARHVILATNGYTSHLLPEFTDLIVPERGVMTALLPPRNSTRLDNSYGFVGAMGGNPIHDDYLNQRPFSDVPNPAGHLMFGGGHVAKTLNMIGETDDSVLDEGSTRYLREALLKLLILGGESESAGLKALEATHEWSGIWGTSIDHHPWVGAVPGRAGVWLAGGYSGTYVPYIRISLPPPLCSADYKTHPSIHSQKISNQPTTLTIHYLPPQATACPTPPSAPRPSSICSYPTPTPPTSKPPSSRAALYRTRIS